MISDITNPVEAALAGIASGFLESRLGINMDDPELKELAAKHSKELDSLVTKIKEREKIIKAAEESAIKSEREAEPDNEDAWPCDAFMLVGEGHDPLVTLDSKFARVWHDANGGKVLKATKFARIA